jgi:2-phosphosulfolactate phosphatase
VNAVQEAYELRCEWGLEGLRHAAPGCDAVVVVDVLSFSTAVDVAVGNGATVKPALWKPGGERSLDKYSLSPASLRNVPAGTELVLPSPNGGTLCLSAGAIPTFTACLRNAPAVAAWLAGRAARVAVIPAGERWEDGTLRPAIEDWLSAGALLRALSGKRSPEAEMAVAVFEACRGDLLSTLTGCESGRELVERGFACDVALAAEFGVSTAVPLLAGGRFVDAVR